MLKKVLVMMVVDALGAVGYARFSEAGAARTSAVLRGQVLGHERLIARCMTERGFEYEVALPADVLLEEARFVAEKAGRDVAAALEAVELPTNPNDAIVRSLSSEQQEVYADAYWGTSTTNGCYYLTYEEAWGVDIRTLNRVAEGKLVEAERRIAGDPRIVGAKADFVDCMNRRGYGFTSTDQINQYEFDQQDEVVEEITGAPPIPGGGVEVDHPLWQDYLSRMVEFEEGLAGCEPEYLGVVQPIENEYLGHNR
jgi:hypothetical protein